MNRNLHFKMHNFTIWRFIFVCLLFWLQVLGAKEKRISITVNDASWLCDNLFVFWHAPLLPCKKPYKRKYRFIWYFSKLCWSRSILTEPPLLPLFCTATCHGPNANWEWCKNSKFPSHILCVFGVAKSNLFFNVVLKVIVCT